MRVTLSDAIEGKYLLTEEDARRIECVISRGRSRDLRWAVFNALRLRANQLRPNALYDRVIKSRAGKWQYVAESDHRVETEALQCILYQEFQTHLNTVQNQPVA